MKTLFALIVLTISTSTFAGLKYICKEVTPNSYDDKKTMILTQVGNASVKEGVKYPFHVEVFEPRNSKAIVSEKVVVETEDVFIRILKQREKDFRHDLS